MTDAEIIARALQPYFWGPMLKHKQEYREDERAKAQKMALKNASKIISALTEAGMAIRPMEPTDEMLKRGGEECRKIEKEALALNKYSTPCENLCTQNTRIYKAMFGAGK